MYAWAKALVTDAYEAGWDEVERLADALTLDAQQSETAKEMLRVVFDLEDYLMRVASLSCLVAGWCERERAASLGIVTL